MGGARYRLPLSIPLAAGLTALLLALSAGVEAGAPPGMRRPESGVRLRAGRAGEPLPSARSRSFPHLLSAFGPRGNPSLVPQAWNPRRSLPSGNAAWEPGSPLPPSILGSGRRDRASSMLEARDSREFLRAFREAKAQAGATAGPDTMRILALRVDFLKDTPGSKSTGNGRFDLRRDAESRAQPIDPPPHDRKYFLAHLEALSRYYRVMSGGSLVLAWDVYPTENDSTYHLPDTRKYGPWIWSNSNPDVLLHAIDLVGDALAIADSTDPSLDFTMTRGDSLVPRYDSFILFHSGADFQGDLNGDSPWDIPSFNLYVQEPFVVQDSSVAINLVEVVPESANQDGFWAALNGVITHEFGHQIGFTDLYDVRNGTSVVGAFSLMDSGEQLYGVIADPQDTTQVLPVRGMLPASVDPWHKVLFFPDGVDLAQPDDFLSGDSSRFEIPLPSSQLGNRILYVPLNLSEYLLIENRAWDLNGDKQIVLKSDHETGVVLGPIPADTLAPVTDNGYREYDWLLPAEGILAWHIDNLAIDRGLGTDYGGVNIFFSRPGVAVLEADGIRDIGTASNEYIGGPYDTWYQGGYTCLGPTTVPSSRTNDGTPTGLTMCALDSIGVTARVSVETGLAPAGWPVVIPGAPREEQLLVLPGGGHGPYLFAASGNALYGWRPDGTPELERGSPDGKLVTFDLPLEYGLAVSGGILQNSTFDYPPVAAVVTGGTLRVVFYESGRSRIWPSAAPGDSLVTATPVLDPPYAWVGCGDGRIRAILPDDFPSPLVRLRLQVGTGGVRVLGAGLLGEEGAEAAHTCFWATDHGESGAASWRGPGNEPRILFRAERNRPGVTPSGVLAIPATAGGGPARFLFAWSDGLLEWRTSDGTLLPGWPASLDAAPAGSPIVCDADGDGVLETVAADVNGGLHCLGVNGVEEFGWPRSVWTEDNRNPPAQVLGVRALDIDGAGAPEILVQRADGFLVALDGRGEAVPGWPRALGADARLGPAWIPAGPANGPRLAFGNRHESAGAESPATAIGVMRVNEALGVVPGSFPAPGFDAARSRVYARELVPTPVVAPVEGPRESLRLYPNPLRGDQLTVRFTLDRPAKVRLVAYDLSGQRVAELEAEGRAGPDGNQLPWQLGNLASGLYQVRVRFLGDGWDEEMLEKIAVMR
jgi:M6 family metalloprotease-like protein